MTQIISRVMIVIGFSLTCEKIKPDVDVSNARLYVFLSTLHPPHKVASLKKRKTTLNLRYFIRAPLLFVSLFGWIVVY